MKYLRSTQLKKYTEISNGSTERALKVPNSSLQRF